MLFVLKGSLRADIYTNEKVFLESADVSENEMIILFDGGHGFEVTAPGTVILEAKNGPYFGVEKDKIKF
ncbi:hypothetical protein SDC9_153699 [bioreactor metagenome]|uniref:Mannose-6-phosphate isomerase n=1 Tax=bioreactor metagenome TaxID=1076179 RepID=A0A645F1B5_9ZZZZ